MAVSSTELKHQGAPTSDRLARSRSQAASLVAADALTIALALALALQLRSLIVSGGVGEVHDSSLLLGTAAVPVWILIFSRYRLYRPLLTASRLEELKALVHAVATSVLVTAGATHLLGFDAARGWLLIMGLVAVPLLGLERELWRWWVRGMRRRGHLLRPALVVGRGLEAHTVGSALEGNPALGFKLMGFVATGDRGPAEAGGDSDGDRVVGHVDDITRLATEVGAETVIIASTEVAAGLVNRLSRELTAQGISVDMTLPLRDVDARRIRSGRLGRFSLVRVEPVEQGWRPAAKRAFDVAASATGLALVSPVLVVAGLAVKVSSPGPVLFRQERVGRDGQRFQILKLRTMVRDAEERIDEVAHRNESGGPLFKMRDDPRVTRVGRVLRATSIDELPQLWNVLRGEMSLVGPRPALAREMGAWPPELHQRLRVRPGITGMWQVGGRAQMSFDEYVRLDLYYVDNWSLLSDLVIILQTIPVLALRRGGY